MTRTSTKVAAVTAAALIGAGAGAGTYAAIGGSSTAAPATTTVVQAQPASSTQTVTTLTQLYKNVNPGVVDITVNGQEVQTPFGGGGGQQSQAEGSGFVYDTAGHIITNEHVVEGAQTITVKFADGKTATATVVGTDPSTDIAVLKVNVASSELHPLALGSSAAVQPGQEVVAFGSPLGLPETMTSGIVSAVDRTIDAPNNYSISGAIQTDAAINHGNSGGPLVDTSGKVIGVNAQIASDSGGNDGIGFAIPIDTVKSVANGLIQNGKVEHAYLGIRVGDAANGAGASVGSVTAGSPAASAGLKAGDVITAVDGKSVSSADQLTAIVGGKAPNDKVTLTVKRGSQTLKITVTLGVRPS